MAKESRQLEQGTMSVARASLTSLSGASASAVGLLPAGAAIHSVATRVKTAITGATDFDIGDGTDVDAFGAAIAIALDTTSTLADWTVDPPQRYGSATDVVLTANGGSFTAGDVDIEVQYYLPAAPP